MMESSNEKKRIFYMFVLILTLITMIISATIAYFSFIGSQKEDGTVLYTGTLAINYIDGTYIKDPELFPRDNVDYSTTKNVYRNTFAITSSGTLDQTISVDLIVSRNDFNENALKYAIFNEQGGRMATGYVPQDGSVNLANNMYLESNDTTKYTLIIWLDNTGYNQNFEMGSAITGRISVYAKQIKY